jgi:hypothetical protein
MRPYVLVFLMLTALCLPVCRRYSFRQKPLGPVRATRGVVRMIGGFTRRANCAMSILRVMPRGMLRVRAASAVNPPRAEYKEPVCLQVGERPRRHPRCRVRQLRVALQPCEARETLESSRIAQLRHHGEMLDHAAVGGLGVLAKHEQRRRLPLRADLGRFRAGMGRDVQRGVPPGHARQQR